MEFLGLSIYAWITVVTVIAMFTLLLRTKLPVEIVFLGGIAVLYITGVLSTEEALSGFSSTSVVTVGALFIVVGGLEHTGVLQWIVKNILGTPKSYAKAIVRIMMPAAVLSAFMSNTTVVALFINVVKKWAKKLNFAPSQLLMPLTYAACMGGACTLIGSPANLVIANFYADYTGEQVGIFAPTLPALCTLFAGILTLVVFRRLIPVRKAPESSFENSSEYTAELLVPSDSQYVVMTAEEAGLYNIKGGRLIEIIRFDREIVNPVGPDEFILGGDRLVYSGDVSAILELKSTHGLAAANHHVFSLQNEDGKRRLRTAIVCQGSPLIDHTVGQTDLEEQGGVTLVAVARRGERINESPRDIKLRMGDVVLLETPKNDVTRTLSSSLTFFDSDDIPNIGPKTLLSSVIMLAMILLSAFHIVPLLQSCFIAALAMLLTKCLPVAQVDKCINWNVLMVFAGSVSLGVAIDKSGLAVMIANGLMEVCAGNPLLVLGGICLLGTSLTEFISNTACSAMLAPIAFSSAAAMGVNPMTFCVALMIAASSSFATPIGSPTHLLVYGPGGYRFSDFFRVGMLLDVALLIVNIVVVTIFVPL